jgi:hypothetical protein
MFFLERLPFAFEELLSVRERALAAIGRPARAKTRFRTPISDNPLSVFVTGDPNVRRA